MSRSLCFLVETLRRRGRLDRLLDLPCKLWRHPFRHAHEELVELLRLDELDEKLFLAARNLHKVDVRDATGIDPVSLIAFDKVVMTADAVKQVEEMLA